jgi:hypothetical protein
MSDWPFVSVVDTAWLLDAFRTGAPPTQGMSQVTNLQNAACKLLLSTPRKIGTKPVIESTEAWDASIVVTNPEELTNVFPAKS